jgi:hypothetical protein
LRAARGATRDPRHRRSNIVKKQPLGQVIIHGKDGKVLEEHTYGQDPKSKG